MTLNPVIRFLQENISWLLHFSKNIIFVSSRIRDILIHRNGFNSFVVILFTSALIKNKISFFLINYLYFSIQILRKKYKKKLQLWQINKWSGQEIKKKLLVGRERVKNLWFKGMIWRCFNTRILVPCYFCLYSLLYYLNIFLSCQILFYNVSACYKYNLILGYTVLLNYNTI